jgi:ubiquinone/menaquinone biosynthesis C-methylase UbiE
VQARTITPAYLEEVVRREGAYDGRPVAERTMRKMRALRAARPGESVLDVGCGIGTITGGFAELGFAATGIDVVEEFVEVARERFPAAQFVVGAAEELPFDDASFDYVALQSLLEHARDWRRVLAETVRVLKPGGVLNVATTNKWSPRQREIRHFPAFGLYPRRLQRALMDYAMRRRPQWVAYTHLPAYNWFSYSQLAEELRRLGAEPHHWLELRSEDELPARLDKPVLRTLVRYAIRHPVPLTYPLELTTMLYAQKEGSGGADAAGASGQSTTS